MELYYNDNGMYPVQFEEAITIPDLSRYLGGNLPQSPTPADGTCTPQENQYLYYSDGKTFMLGVCLGGETNGLAPGFHIMTPLGFDKYDGGVPPENDLPRV